MKQIGMLNFAALRVVVFRYLRKNTGGADIRLPRGFSQIAEKRGAHRREI